MREAIAEAWGSEHPTGLSLLKLEEAVHRMGCVRGLRVWGNATRLNELARQAQAHHNPEWHDGRLVSILGMPVELRDGPCEVGVPGDAVLIECYKPCR